MSRRIGILTLILACVGLYVYFYVGQEVSPEVEKVLNFRPEDVREIVLRRKDQSLLFKMEDGQWKIKKPLAADVDKNKVYELLSAFNYGLVRVIETTSSDLSKYGLSAPEIEIGIKVKGDEAFQTLMIGSNSPTSSSCYARVKGQPGVLLVGVRYKIAFNRCLSYFY